MTNNCKQLEKTARQAIIKSEMILKQLGMMTEFGDVMEWNGDVMEWNGDVMEWRNKYQEFYK